MSVTDEFETDFRPPNKNSTNSTATPGSTGDNDRRFKPRDCYIDACQGETGVTKRTAADAFIERIRAAMELREMDEDTLKEFLLPSSVVSPEVPKQQVLRVRTGGGQGYSQGQETRALLWP